MKTVKTRFPDFIRFVCQRAFHHYLNGNMDGCCRSNCKQTSLAWMAWFFEFGFVGLLACFLLGFFGLVRVLDRVEEQN